MRSSFELGKILDTMKVFTEARAAGYNILQVIYNYFIQFLNYYYLGD